MEKDNLKNLFEKLDGQFDIETPSIGHQDRFLSKLKTQDTKVTMVKSKGKNIWKPLIAVAASVILCLSLFTITQQEPEVKDLASVSPELSKTQDFFTTAINKELALLKDERSPETKVLVDDALKQLNILEKEYELLKVDLTESGDDKRVIYAMISNFQTRIDVLQSVLENIEQVKQLKQQNNEIKNTI